jgi:hypothetical protein
MPVGPHMTLERVVERAIEHAVLGGELGRREFIRRIITVDAKFLHYKEY